jgi:hypothetical protein
LDELAVDLDEFALERFAPDAFADPPLEDRLLELFLAPADPLDERELWALVCAIARPPHIVFVSPSPPGVVSTLYPFPERTKRKNPAYPQIHPIGPPLDRSID